MRVRHRRCMTLGQCLRNISITGSGRAMKYEVGEFSIDTARYRVSAGRSPLRSSRRSSTCWCTLIRHRDRVLTREELFRDVWDGREVSDATLSNHVKVRASCWATTGSCRRRS